MLMNGKCVDIVHIIVCHAVDTQHLHANTHFLQPKNKNQKERERENFKSLVKLGAFYMCTIKSVRVLQLQF